MQAHILYFDPSTHGIVSIDQKFILLNVVMLHNKLKDIRIDQRASRTFDLKHTPDLWVAMKGQILKLYR